MKEVASGDGMRIWIAGFLVVTMCLSGCGEGNGKPSVMSSSGDAKAGNITGTIVELDDLERFKSHQIISDAVLVEFDQKTFGFIFQLRDIAKQSRQCDVELRVRANQKVEFAAKAVSWQASFQESVIFKFQYSDFDVQQRMQISEIEAALRLDCRVLGELD